MTKDAFIKTEGMKELNKYILQFVPKFEKNIKRGMTRAAAKPVMVAAKANAPTGEPSETAKRKYKVYNGALRDSIRISTRVDKRNKQVVARVIAGGKSKKTGADVFYPHIIEYGSSPHSVKKGGRGEVTHPGMSPQPFMRPALDSEAGNAIKAAGEYVKKRLRTKHGIDTKDITIEVEE